MLYIGAIICIKITNKPTSTSWTTTPIPEAMKIFYLLITTSLGRKHNFKNVSRKRKISFLGKVALSIPIAAAGINILAKIKGAGDDNSGYTDREKENDYNDNIKHDKFFDDDEFEAM